MARGTPARSSGALNDGAPEVSIEGGAVGDRIYQGTITFFALCVPILLLFIAYEIVIAAWPALRHFGTDFLTTRIWDPVNEVYGVAPAIYGTLATSAIALLVATPLALGVAIFLSEFAPPWLRQPVAFLVDLLAAIPSVVYGLWGIVVLLPLLRNHIVPFLGETLGLSNLPIFAGDFYPGNILAAGLILAIMVLPYISAVAREILLAVPRSQREAALALGATRWEMIWGAVLPFAKSGILGGIILGLGRALGETMAVTMVIGNRPEIPTSLLQPGYTLASQIANQFLEATGELQVSALMAAAFVLFAITLVVNAIARWLVWRVGREVRA
ncbi:MAG TPA: phosphate ABC transporter permease subunit PstC [Gemmatimonadaceae bacterium]|nr:phosphate ABC transporter permease subunit PstC [Gemmatimonadaceae bacterium]